MLVCSLPVQNLQELLIEMLVMLLSKSKWRGHFLRQHAVWLRHKALRVLLVSCRQAQAMRLLAEQSCERRRRKSLLGWLQEETDPASSSGGHDAWKALDIFPSGDTPQGWEPLVEEIIMDVILHEHEFSGSLGEPALPDNLGGDSESNASPRKHPPRWRRDRDLLTMAPSPIHSVCTFVCP